MITAEEARKMYQPSVDDALEQAYKMIKEVYKTKRHVYLQGDFWSREGYNNSPRYNQAKKRLEELGFKVWFQYEESQTFNMYTVVEW